MIGGCFKNFFAMIGCFVLLVIGVILVWYFWPQIKDLYDERVTIAATGVVIATPGSARITRRKGR